MSSSPDRFKAAAETLFTLQLSLDGELVTLSPQARKHAVRAPAGFETYLRALTSELARLPGVVALVELDPDGIEPAFAQVQAVESALFAARRLVEQLEDTRTHLRGQLWDRGLEAYATCQAMGRRDPRYLRAVEAMAPAFQRKRKTAKAKADT